MSNRATSILLLLWLVPFLGVVAPGHQRGAVQLPGGEGLSAGAPTCALCDTFKPTPGPGSPDNSTRSDVPATPSDPAGNCAVCQFNGTLLNPPPFALPNLRPQRLDLPADESALALQPTPKPLPRLSGRAPPAIAAV